MISGKRVVTKKECNLPLGPARSYRLLCEQIAGKRRESQHPSYEHRHRSQSPKQEVPRQQDSVTRPRCWVPPYLPPSVPPSLPSPSLSPFRPFLPSLVPPSPSGTLSPSLPAFPPAWRKQPFRLPAGYGGGGASGLGSIFEPPGATR